MQALYFCHPEPTLVGEGSAVLSFSAACEGAPHISFLSEAHIDKKNLCVPVPLW
jgi:hypothetical protein